MGIEDEKKRLEGLIQGVNAIRRKTDGAFIMMSAVRDRAVRNGTEADREDTERILEYLNGAREGLRTAEHALKSASCVCGLIGEDDATLQRALATI